MVTKAKFLRLADHAVRHPNDRAAWKLVARKFGIGTNYAHRQGIYWKAR